MKIYLLPVTIINITILFIPHISLSDLSHASRIKIVAFAGHTAALDISQLPSVHMAGVDTNGCPLARGK